MNIRKFFSKDSFLTQLLNFGLAPVIGMGLGMLTVPVTTRLLAPDEFGKANFFTLAVNLINLVILLGLDQAYVRFYNQKDIPKKTLLANCIFIPAVFLSVVLVSIVIFRRELSEYMFGKYEPDVMLALLIYLPTVLLNRFAFLSLQMELRGKTFSALSILQQVLNFVLLLPFLCFFERTFRSIIYAATLSLIIPTLIAVITCKQFSVPRPSDLDKNLLKGYTLYSLPFVPITVISWLMASFDRFALRTWCNFEEIGIYSAALKLVAPISVIESIFKTVWIPVAYKWYQQDAPTEKYEDAGNLLFAFFIAVFGLLVVVRSVIVIFLGNSYREASGVFIFLMFQPVLTTVSYVTGQGIEFAKKTILNLYICIISSAFNLVGNWLLTPRYGVLGAAVATSLSYAVFAIAAIFFARGVWVKFHMSGYIINILLMLVLAFSTFFQKYLEYAAFTLIIAYNLFSVLKILKRQKGSQKNE